MSEGFDYGQVKAEGPFDRLGRFAEFGWYAIIGWVRIVREEAEHPFVSREWTDIPGQGVYRLEHDNEPRLIARRARFV